MTAEATITEALAFVDTCTAQVDLDADEGGVYAVLCGEPAVDDEDEPRCAEHLGMDWA